MIKNTPYYKIDEQKLQNNLDSMLSAFKKQWNKSVIGYSFKTNNLPWILNWMRLHGAKAEVVSYAEFQLAKAVGFSCEEIIYNGPCKGYDGILEAVNNGSIVNLDNFEEVNFLSSQTFNNEIKVGLRINFNLEKYCPGETITGKEPGRFGFNLANGDFNKAINQLHTNSKIKVVGIHGHHSTKTKSLKIFRTITERMCEVVNSLDNLEYMDIGGCLFGDKAGAPSFDEYATTIIEVLKHNNISQDVTLIIEPGAALIASPVSYVCSVTGLKDIKGLRLVFTDGSIKHIAPQMNEIKFKSVTSSQSEIYKGRQVVTGFSCIEKDRFLEYQDASELKIGDEIEVFNTGAYSLCLAPLFIEFYPKVIVKSHDEYKVVREAWGVNEFLQKNYF